MKNIRRENLRKWIAKNGVPTKEKSYFSQLINGVSPFGEKSARRLEHDYKMGKMYLDHLRESNDRGQKTVPDSIRNIPITRRVQRTNADQRPTRTNAGKVIACTENTSCDIEFFLDKAADIDHPSQDGDIKSSVKKMTISLSFLRGFKFSSVENLALTSAIGDSMEGTYSDGDLLLIDQGVHQIKGNGIYGLTLAGEVFTRRIERRPNGDIFIISDNTIYDPYIVPSDAQEKLKISYRVVFSWTGKKFS